jgi:small GTP-binding protein
MERKKRPVIVRRKGQTSGDSAAPPKKRADFFMKLVLCGDGAVGKTAIRERFLGRGFSSSYLQTIGADFAATEKTVTVDNNNFTVNYQIWDLAGQTEFGSVRKTYYEGCFGSLMIFDITRPSSFENLPTWINELWSNSGRGQVPIVLLGNKSDLKDKFPEHVREQQIKSYVKDLNSKLGSAGFFVEYLETSAMNGLNIEEAFKTIGKQVVTWIKSNK